MSKVLSISLNDDNIENIVVYVVLIIQGILRLGRRILMVVL